MMLTGCASGGWTKEEKALVEAEGQMMRVTTIDNAADSLLLRRKSAEFSRKALGSPEMEVLARKMIATVTDPSQNGVGIAGPQVGLLRRVVAVQRFDKEGEPFEVYPNIRITATRGEKSLGREGCLSVPKEYVPGNNGHAMVERWRDIDISYWSLTSHRDTTETIKGFTAVIFQHECDHLDGVLFIDRL